MQNETLSHMNWRSVGLYYALACLWSWPFFWRRDMLGYPDAPLDSMHKVFIHWGMMWGPGIAALVCFSVFRRSHRRTINLGGTSWARSVVFFVIPFLLMTAFHAHPLYGYDVLPLAAAFPVLISVLGEELGWRGFLQDALRPLRPVKRYILIGVMWEFWHFTTRVSHGFSWHRITTTLAISYTAVIALSFIFGYATERSKSVLVAASLHLFVDILLNNLDLYMPLTLTALIWVGLMITWPTAKSDQKVISSA